MAVKLWYKVLLSQCYVLLLLTSLSQQCGPGRGGYRRQSSKQSVPLVYKQAEPNVGENMLSASGPGEGKITRGDERFKKLVECLNPEIMFKDEEKTGADRRMTQRCKDKLNSLAIAVMNQWPGVRLRVTEAWDEDGEHAEDSLHYEGRAVDITTSDRDREKYGMLARLAVDAGFDWVYYELRGHIHCSVKSDSYSQPGSGCFAGSELVTLRSGQQIPLSQLQIGDEVISLDANGNRHFSPVLLFFHKDPAAETTFVQIKTSLGKTLEVTPNHVMFVQRTDAPAYISNTPEHYASVFAKDVAVGDKVLQTVTTNETLQTSDISDVTYVTRRGYYAPLTQSGTMVVNGIHTSCYAHIYSHDIAHAALAPLRWYYTITSSPRRSDYFSQSDTPWFFSSSNVSVSRAHVTYTDGTTSRVHWYAYVLRSVATWVLPSSWLYQS